MIMAMMEMMTGPSTEQDAVSVHRRCVQPFNGSACLLAKCALWTWVPRLGCEYWELVLASRVWC